MTTEALKDTARVKISAETLKLTDSPLRAGYKGRLRRQKAIELIRNTPAGQRLTLNDFGRAMNMKGDSNIDSIVKSLMRHGTIVRHAITPKTFSYSIPGDAKVKDVEKAVVQLSKEVEPIKIDSSNPWTRGVNTRVYPLSELKEKAMKFGWHHQENNNDLRAFMKWLEEQE